LIMEVKKPRLSSSSQRIVREDAVPDLVGHFRKTAPTPAPPPSEEERNLPIISEDTQPADAVKEPTPAAKKRPLSEIDISADIISKTVKFGGIAGYIPLSIGRLADFWFLPEAVSLCNPKDPVASKLQVKCRVVFESSPHMLDPYDVQCGTSFRSDTDEVLRMAYMLDHFIRAYSGTREICYTEWYRICSAKFHADQQRSPNTFAVDVMTATIRNCTAALPKSLKIVLCKKPTSTFILPEEGIKIINQNVSCMQSAGTGFKYEFRMKMVILKYRSGEEEGKLTREFTSCEYEEEDPMSAEMRQKVGY